MNEFYFISSRVEINEFKDVEIKEKGSLKTEIVNGKKRIVGTGIYDETLFSTKSKEGEGCEKVNFYIKLNASSPSGLSNYSVFGNLANTVKNFLEYNCFLYDDEVITDVEKFDFPGCDDNLFFFGEEGCIKYLQNFISKRRNLNNDAKINLLQTYENWIKKNNTNFFLISDLKLRKPKLIKEGKEIYNSDLNLMYEKMFDINENNSLFFKFKNIPGYLRFFSSRNIFKVKSEVEESLITHLSAGKKSLVKKEGISEKLSGAIRGTIVPSPFIQEDEIEIGTIFANHLYPEFIGLWKDSKELNWLISRGVLSLPKELFRYTPDWMTEDELIEASKRNNFEYYNYYYPWWPKKYSFIPEDKIDQIKEDINKKRMQYYKTHKSDVEYVVLVDRNPTICQLSMFSAKPIFKDSIGMNVCRDIENEPLKNISSYNFNTFKDKIEKVVLLSEDIYPEDTIGIYPLPCDGMNADYDGDVVLIAALYSIQANIEARNLFASLNYVSVDSGNIRNKIPKEFMCAMKNIYKNNPELAKKIHNIINKKG